LFARGAIYQQVHLKIGCSPLGALVQPVITEAAPTGAAYQRIDQWCVAWIAAAERARNCDTYRFDRYAISELATQMFDSSRPRSSCRSAMLVMPTLVAGKPPLAGGPDCDLLSGIIPRNHLGYSGKTAQRSAVCKKMFR
jgi:hypothetical protein